MNRWTVIVSGGMLEEEFARSVLENPEIEFIIGVDRGLEFLTGMKSARIILWEILTAYPVKF
mgnify:FL=1